MGSGSYNAHPFTPRGIIAIFTGLIANIPTGWAVCDGNNGTPNLLSRFIKGVATAVTDPGTTGGNQGHQHFGIGAHDHTMAHTHGSDGPSATMNLASTAGATTGTSTHTHTSGATSSNITSNEFGLFENTDTRPPYFDVAYIMKL